MKTCTTCGSGKIRSKILPYFEQPWGEESYRLENIPALVCGECGEIYFEAKVGQAMDEALIAIEKSSLEPKRFDKVPVFEVPALTPA